MLSYVGGLFSILFGFLVFFLGAYNEYGYELAIGAKIFGSDESGKRDSSKNYNFFTYIQYSFYDWAKAFHIPISWRKMEELDEVR